MHHPFVPLLLLGFLPLAYLAHRLGVLSHPAMRWLLGGIGVAFLIVGAYAGGMDFAVLKRIKLGIAILMAAWLLWRHQAAPGEACFRSVPTWLPALALLAWVVYLNFFSFHGARTYVHVHDVAHYYLGSKYFTELGYGNLYIAMLRAEAERFDDHFKSIEARDLRTNALVHIRVLLARSGAVKARFTPERWDDFQLDVAYFREAMGHQYGEILRDHGFNPTPFWVLIGGSLANLVPAGSAAGILRLCLLDLALLAVMFLGIGWAFGAEMALIAMIYFCVLFGAGFGWTGGAFLRHMWLVGLVAAVCCVRRGYHALAGGLLAWATLLRIFPVAFLYGLACKAVWDIAARRSLPRTALRMLASFVATSALLFAVTGLLPGRFANWQGFRINMERHLQHTAYNTIGLTEILAYRGPAKPTSADAVRADLARRSHLRTFQLAALLPLAAIGMALRSRRDHALGAIVMAAPLPLFVGVNLAAYYYAFLLVVLIVHGEDSRALALIFAAEALSYALLLFEDREVAVYFYRNLVVLYLLAALYLEEKPRLAIPVSLQPLSTADTPPLTGG